MANLTGNLKDSVTATFPREFDIPNAMTLGEIYDRLNERASAFQMPFSVKGGVPGERIVFAKEPNLDVTIWLHVKNGTHIKITPVTQSSSATINGIDVGKNSVMRKGIKGVASRPMLQGQYIDGVTDTIKKILAGEAVRGLCGAGSRARRGQASELADAPAAVHLRRRRRYPSLLCRQDRHGRSLSVHRRSVRHRLARRSHQDRHRKIHGQERQRDPEKLSGTAVKDAGHETQRFDITDGKRSQK